MNIDNHPCFNVKAHKSFGRVHLPVAPRCNIQCKFCNRKFDCVNESRPGVTSGILTPQQAMIYLEEVFREKQNISVVGIAGPGDPFANPEETMETLRLVREKYPEVMLCLATNGLNLLPYIPELAELNVSHVTVTINAVDPEIGKNIYSWVRHNKRALRAEEGVAILLEKQLAAVKSLKEHGIMVKINSIIIPGINDEHIKEVARTVGDMKVDILNCVPYYPCEGSAFEHMAEPDKSMVERVRKEAGEFVKQMRHCTRCRADAVGILGEKPSEHLMNTLRACEQIKGCCSEIPAKDFGKNVAVASMEGVLVNQHLGEAGKLLVYRNEGGNVSLMEARETPEKGGGGNRWMQMAETFNDCSAILVGGVGEKPKTILGLKGIDVIEIEGVIEDAVSGFFDGSDLRHMQKRIVHACGAGCTGNGGGCG